MPVVVTQGILSHMKEPLKGINAVSLLAKVVEKIDLNPLLSDSIYGEQAPLPSWSYMRDLKENYDVSTVLRAAGYFSVLYLDKSPKELMTTIQQLCQEAIDEFYERYQALQVTYKEDKKVTKPHVLTYEELIQLCQKKAGFEGHRPFVELYYKGERLTTHNRFPDYMKNKYSTHPEDMPPTFRNIVQWDDERIRNWASSCREVYPAGHRPDLRQCQHKRTGL